MYLSAIIFLVNLLQVYNINLQGGLSTSEEMCLAFLYYYPRTSIGQCISEPLYTEVSSDAFHATDVMYSWDWTDQSVRDKFKGILRNTTYYQHCHGQSNPASNHVSIDNSSCLNG